jgi:hypothetical protein
VQRLLIGAGRRHGCDGSLRSLELLDVDHLR